MNLCFDRTIIDSYTSSSQQIRILTEDWVNQNGYCPNCGSSIHQYPNNKPVADFYCGSCREEYELKSKKDSMGNKIVDGAYATMARRLAEFNNPNFFFLNYMIGTWEVINFLVIPKHFFTLEIIEKRKALSEGARRHGFVGCNILLQSIPEAGKIFFVHDKIVESESRVIEHWKKTLFLRERQNLESRGWTLMVMSCIDRLAKKEFLLDDIYAFEKELRNIYPNNKHIKDKIRQQLQILRDKGYLEFVGGGKYRLTTSERVDEGKTKWPHDLLTKEEQFIDQIERDINEKLKFTEYLPVYSLQAACGGFGEGREVEKEGWIKVSEMRLSTNMFVARVKGKSMEPKIRDDSFCIFRTPVVGSRQNKIVLVQHNSIDDPDNGGKFTVKKYTSKKRIISEESFEHEEIILVPLNLSFKPIVIPRNDYDEFIVVAEFLRIL